MNPKALKRYLFASLLGISLTCFGIWFYRHSGTPMHAPLALRATTIAACVICVSVGVIFLSHALRQSKSPERTESLLDVVIPLASGGLLVGFSFWFYRAEATQLFAERDAWHNVMKADVAELRSAKTAEIEKSRSLEAFILAGKEADLRELQKRAKETEDSARFAFSRITREHTIVAVSSSACAFLGAAFLLAGLKKWFSTK